MRTDTGGNTCWATFQEMQINAVPWDGFNYFRASARTWCTNSSATLDTFDSFGTCNIHTHMQVD